MNIDDLLGLLRDEYAMGLPEARQGLVEAADAGVASAVVSPALTDFLEKSSAAAELVGMSGFSEYMRVVSDVAQRTQACADSALNPAPARTWIAQALDFGEQYLSAPGDGMWADIMLDHLGDSCVALDEASKGALSAALRSRPVLVEEDDAAAAIAPIGEEDLVLKREDADEGLLDLMLADAPRQLDQIHANVVALGEHAADESVLAESQRIAHTLKGSGSIIGLPALSRVAHRLEDLLEWFTLLHRSAQVPPSDAITDALRGIDCLQQIVGYLNGDEAEPTDIHAVLTRLAQWSQAIIDGTALDNLPSADSTATQTGLRGDDIPSSVRPKNATESSTSPAPGNPEPSEDVYLRVGANHLRRLLRRATQSIISAQRLTQQLREIQNHLSSAQHRQGLLSSRLRELQATVERQAVDLTERRDATGLFDPLEMDRYDSLHILSRFVSEAVQDQAEITQEALALSSTAIASVRDEQRALREQHRDLLSTRLVAVKSIESRLRRNVAQTAREMGKSVRLVLKGEQTAVDSDVLARLTEPLLHLLRNAVDHGIEPVTQRISAGKSAEGTITLDFKVEEQSLRVECSDDGDGLNLTAIRLRAIRYGILEPNVPISDTELRQIILQRGFSTKNEVTEISGRGVGMDIVNDRINAMKGTLQIASISGQGTTFTLRVPTSGGIVLALVVRSGGQRVAISSEQVITAFAPTQTDAASRSVMWEGARYPLQSLASWLGFTDQQSDAVHGAGVLVRGDGGAIVALAVEAVLEVRELVVQDVGALLRKISGLSVAALDETGRVMFLLDIAALERRARSAVAPSAAMALRNRVAASRRRLLVVDDSSSARRALQTALEDRGYEVTVANDGAEAIDVLRSSDIAIVLTDLEMPNVNGMELTRRMRDVPHWARIPVVMITSRTGEKYRDLALATGVSDYMVKPYNDSELFATVQRNLDHALHEPEALNELAEPAALAEPAELGTTD